MKTVSGDEACPEAAIAGTPEVAITPLWVVVGLGMAPAVTQGLARFAYALLLPSMRADLGWSYANAGAMNTANAFGYLAGAISTAMIAARLGEKRAFMLGLVLTTAAVAAPALTTDFSILLALRAFAGFVGAIAFITGGALAAAAAAGGGRSRAPIALGLYFAGGGFGILVSALVVPPLLAVAGWREGWLGLGVLGVVGCIAVLPALRQTPAPVHAPRQTAGRWSPRMMAMTTLAYFLFGAGYIAYVTFIVAFLRGAGGFTAPEISAFWALLGAAGMGAGFAWGPVLARLRGGWGATATMAMVTLGAALPMLSTGRVAVYLSALLFGGSFLSVFVAITASVRRTVAPHAWTAAIGGLTVVFGTGQCIGPILSGLLSDGPDGVRLGLSVSVAILALSTLVAALQTEARSVTA